MNDMDYSVESTFETLTFDEKIRHFYDVAERAMERWNIPFGTAMKLLNFTENATFCLEPAGAPKVILRVHRLDYAKLNNIRTELQWLIDLKKETNLNLTSPVESKNGVLVETIKTPAMKEERHVVCFEYVEGKVPVDTSDSNEGVGKLIQKIDKIPDKITIPLFKKAAVLYEIFGRARRKSPLKPLDRILYRQVGIIAGTLHKQTKHWNYPEFYERMEWNLDGTFGRDWNNFYGVSYRSAKWFSQKEISILDACVELIRKRLEAYGKGTERYGMIHSDLRRANLLKNGDRITALDFDDCGMGWYMYDIAGAVGFIEHRPDLTEVVGEIIKGYETVLPVSPQDRQEIWTFIMMRRIGLLQSLIYRIGCVMGGSESTELTPEILAFYAKGTVVLAKNYLRKYKTKLLPDNLEEEAEYRPMHTA